MKRRNLILLLGGASSGAMTIGTGAFSSAQVERGVSVNVTNDEDAFIRYETPNDEAEIKHGGERITLVRVRNQFGGDQTVALVGVEYSDDDEVLENVTVERKKIAAGPDDTDDFDDEDFEDVDEDHVAIERGPVGSYSGVNEDDAFGPGEWVRIVADVDVPPGEEVDIEVTITVKGIKGAGVSAQLFGDSREFTLTGTKTDSVDHITGVRFRGNSGNATIETNPDDVEGTVGVRAYYRSQGGSEGDDVFRTQRKYDIPVGRSLGINDFRDGNNSKPIVGLDIDGIGGIFKRTADSSEQFVSIDDTESEETAFGDNLET